MNHAEFAKATKRQALQRSGRFCEAIGKVYGLPSGQRCNAPLTYGVDFDHYPIRGADGGSAELSNCLAICIKCHRWKTRTFDIPRAAKGKRVADKRTGIKRPAQGFQTNRSGMYRRRMNGDVERGCELLNKIGVRTSINRARIRKLDQSTNIVPARLSAMGFTLTACS